MTASGPEVRSTDTAPPRHSAEMNPWARGLAVFAAVMMMTVGVLHVIAGLVALFENEFYVAGAHYVLQFDPSAPILSLECCMTGLHSEQFKTDRPRL